MSSGTEQDGDCVELPSVDPTAVVIDVADVDVIIVDVAIDVEMVVVDPNKLFVDN